MSREITTTQARTIDEPLATIRQTSNLSVIPSCLTGKRQRPPQHHTQTPQGLRGFGANGEISRATAVICPGDLRGDKLSPPMPLLNAISRVLFYFSALAHPLPTIAVTTLAYSLTIAAHHTKPALAQTVAVGIHLPDALDTLKLMHRSGELPSMHTVFRHATHGTTDPPAPPLTESFTIRRNSKNYTSRGQE